MGICPPIQNRRGAFIPRGGLRPPATAFAKVRAWRLVRETRRMLSHSYCAAELWRALRSDELDGAAQAFFRCRSACGHAKTPHAIERDGRQFLVRADAIRAAARDFRKAPRIRRLRPAKHDERVSGKTLYCILALFRGVADLRRRRDFISVFQARHDRRHVVRIHRSLGNDADLRPLRRQIGIYKDAAMRRDDFPYDSLALGMAFVTDYDDIKPAKREFFRFAMHSRDKRARRIDDPQAAPPRLLANSR